MSMERDIILTHRLTPFARFTEWAKKYGGLMSIKLGSGTALILSDRRIVRELLDKKSSIFSGRPTSYLAQSLITGGDHLLIMDYGPEWRSMRKLLHQEFTEAMCEQHYIKIVNAEAAQMLRDMVMKPQDFMLHPKRFSNSVIMSICMSLQNFKQVWKLTSRSSVWREDPHHRHPAYDSSL